MPPSLSKLLDTEVAPLFANQSSGLLVGQDEPDHVAEGDSVSSFSFMCPPELMISDWISRSIPAVKTVTARRTRTVKLEYSGVIHGVHAAPVKVGERVNGFLNPKRLFTISVTSRRVPLNSETFPLDGWIGAMSCFSVIKWMIGRNKSSSHIHRG
jgi:hypothetical protein